MIVTIREGSDPQAVQRELADRGLWVQRMESGATRPCFWVEAHSSAVDADEVRRVPGVEAVASRPSPHPKVDAQPRTVKLGGLALGPGAPPVWIVGPCSIESEGQMEEIAACAAQAGARVLRGGAFKPRTSPYAFQGHGAEALKWQRRAADAHGLKVVTEAMAPEEAPLVAELADLVQIGSRNMQNFALLRATARAGRPVLLKRGMAATIEEWLLAGEYCLVHGAPQVVFCERGVRGFDPSTRNLLDLGAVALLAHVRGLPVVVDPSHGVGRRDLIAPLARAALGAGAHGLLVETHADPGSALSDGPQAVLLGELAALVRDVARGAHGGAP